MLFSVHFHQSQASLPKMWRKLEEAARFETRYGHKNRSGKGSSRMTAKNEDEILNEILGNDRMESSSSGQQSNTDMFSSIQRASSCASYSNTQQVDALDGGGETRRSHSVDECNHGKSEEALKALKRGKELERQVDALELSIRRKCRKVLSSSYTVEIQNEDGPKESVRKSKRLAQVNGKDNFTAELRELGWSDMDLHDRGKKLVKMSLEGELSSLLGEISGRTNKDMGRSGIDKTQVFELKRKALALKREGKIVEAKEELKKAKVLEQKLEEQELLGVNEDSDDEISALISSMDSDQEDILFAEDEQGHGFDFDHLVGTADDLHVDGNFEVTDEDLVDPELAATLKSLGWTENECASSETTTQSVSIDRETLQSEILSLKREALNHKRVGNVAEAIVHLKKAKLLERDLESLGGEVGSSIVHDTTRMTKSSPSLNTIAKSNVSSKPARRSRLMIQKELLAIKKKALALRREGRLNAAEEELKKGKVLEQQLEEMDNASNVKGKQASVGKSLGWKDDDNEHTITPFNPQESDNLSTQTSNPLVTQSTSNISWRTPRRSKAEIQRELLGLKRKALTLRHEGKIDEAEEVLIAAKALETQIEGMETLKRNSDRKKICMTHHFSQMLTNLGWKDDGVEALPDQEAKVKVQRDLLGLKRKALSLRRNGETEECEELLKMAKVLESQIDDLEGPKKELFPDASEDKKYQSSGSLNNHEKQNNVNNAVEMIEKLAAAAVDTNEKFIESFTGSGRKGSDKTAPPSWSPDIVNQVPFEINEENHPYVGDFDLLGEMGSLSNSRVNQGTEFFPPPNQSMNLMDLLTGDDWSSPQIPARKLEDKVDFGSDISCLLEPHVHVGSLKSGLEHLRSKDREASSISDVSHFPDHHDM
ncbi:hypothetical protein OIU84_028451 [Salix udensis]|uniref:Uncharacterized protein n=1 Tax=Salix udensis TaxID=889485 RepID=A0AAD6P9K7_9ROSI|nr:hypothetical protein OIU84_028451 [Salix udensis]